MKHLLWLLTVAVCSLTAKGQSECHITHFDEFNGMSQWYVTQIVQDRHGMMWFGTWNGLNRYDGYRFECFKPYPGDGCNTPSDRIGDLMLTKEGNLWCFIDERVFLFNVETCRFSTLSPSQEALARQTFERRHAESLRQYNTPYLYIDPFGTEWTIHPEGMLLRRGKDEPQPVAYPAPELKDHPRYCTTDTEGNLWLRSDYGAYKLTFSQKPYTRFPQEKTSQIRFFMVDRQQRYWVSSKEDATVRLFAADNRLLGYLGRDGRLHPQYTSFGSPVYSMLQDHRGTIWLGSKPDGLFRLEEHTAGEFQLTHWQHDARNPYSLSSNEIYYLAEDRQHRLWIATFDGGINCMPEPTSPQPRFIHSGNQLRGYPKATGFERSRQIHLTDDNVLLAATTAGLVIADISGRDFTRMRFKSHTKDIHRANSLSNNATMYVMEDHRHRIFVCTESGGVNQIVSSQLLADQLDFKHYNTQTGLPSDVALSAIDAQDHLLVVCNNQVLYLYPDEERSVSFNAHFWQNQFRFSDAAPVLLPDGRRIFGLQDGAFTVYPQQIHKNTFVPPIALTALSIENGPVDRAVNALDTLELHPPLRDLTLYFAALDYHDAEQISYAFRLGDDKEAWNYIGKDHSATFLDLSPGTYQLQIRSTNSDGLWVENTRTLTLIVYPTFWETRWAQALYALLIALAVWAILYIRLYIRNIKQQQRDIHEAYLALLNAHHQQEMQAAEQQAAVLPSPALQEQQLLAKAKVKAEDDAFMKRAVQFIEEHIDDPDINIGDMADATATSRSGLNRKMKALLGVTPLEFIREARIQRACQMLSSGTPVVDVAYRCGFSDPKYFGKCFKAQTGLTPSDYKAQH